MTRWRGGWRLAAGESYHQIAAEIGMSLRAAKWVAKNPPVDLVDAEWEQLSKLEQWRARRDPSHPLHYLSGRGGRAGEVRGVGGRESPAARAGVRIVRGRAVRAKLSARDD